MPALIFGNATKPSRFAHFWQGAQSLAPATRNDIWTSKSGAGMWCFVHFDLKMCFAPQRRALFRHLNFEKWSDPGVLCTFWLRNGLRAKTACAFRHLNCQKWSENGVLCTFWLPNGLRATTACTFSTSQLPKAVRTWGVFSFFTYKCASRHNGVHFFISHLARWLRTRRFSEPTFRPSGATNHWKTQCFATFLPFRASASSFFWPFLFSDLLSSTLLFSLPLPSSAFHLSILSEGWLLNFLRQITNYKLHYKLRYITNYIALQITLHYQVHCIANYISLPMTLHYKLHYITNYITLRTYIHIYIYVCVYTYIYV